MEKFTGKSIFNGIAIGKILFIQKMVFRFSDIRLKILMQKLQDIIKLRKRQLKN